MRTTKIAQQAFSPIPPSAPHNGGAYAMRQVVVRYQALPVYGVREVPSQNHQKANYEVAQVRNPLQVDSHFANKKKAASSARP
jgi:hypothetical protein